MKSTRESSFPVLTGARQTMLTWAKVIDAYVDIPEVYKSYCKAILEDNHPFPYVVLAPLMRGARHKAAENLLCEVNDAIHVWERVGSAVISTSYPISGIATIEVGSVLLYSWLTINGSTSDGRVASSTIVFNTATARHLAPFIDRIRPQISPVEELVWRTELAKLNHLGVANFKFMNLARESLIAGEKVLSVLLQPKMRQQIFTFFGQKFYRNLALAHLAILTDKEVILIGEDEQSVETKGHRYGGVTLYIPLRSIVAAEVAESGEGLLTLTLTLVMNRQRICRSFESSNAHALADFLAVLQPLIK